MEIAEFIYLGIGSNLGDRIANITAALTELENKNVQIKRCSSIYETAAWGFETSDLFYNCVIECETTARPDELLLLIKTIEKEIGRKDKESSRYESRIIDIDILLYKNEVISTPLLVIPHHYLPERNFVLYPLSELISSVKHPTFQLTIADLKKQSSDESVITIVKPSLIG